MRRHRVAPVRTLPLLALLLLAGACAVGPDIVAQPLPDDDFRLDWWLIDDVPDEGREWRFGRVDLGGREFAYAVYSADGDWSDPAASSCRSTATTTDSSATTGRPARGNPRYSQVRTVSDGPRSLGRCQCSKTTAQGRLLRTPGPRLRGLARNDLRVPI